MGYTCLTPGLLKMLFTVKPKPKPKPKPRALPTFWKAQGWSDKACLLLKMPDPDVILKKRASGAGT
jgi:hypothetical protein